jgi:hypothetical protein
MELWGQDSSIRNRLLANYGISYTKRNIRSFCGVAFDVEKINYENYDWSVSG